MKKLIETKSLSYIALGGLLLRLSPFLVFLLLSSSLALEEYAKYAFIMLILSAVLELVNGGLFQNTQNQVALSADNKIKEKKITESISLALVAYPLIAITSSVLILRKYDASFDTRTFMTVLSVFVYVIGVGFFGLFNAIDIGDRQGKRYAIRVAVAGFTSVCFAALVLHSKLGLNSVVLAIGLSYLASAVFFSIPLESGILFSIEKINRSLRESYIYILWAVLSLLESKLELIILSHFGSAENFVNFDIALKYLIVTQFFTSVVNQSFIPKYLSLSLESRRAEATSVLKMFFATAVTNFLIGLLISGFISVYYHDERGQSAYVFLILSFAIFFNTLAGAGIAQLIGSGLQRQLPKILFIVILIKTPISVTLVLQYGAIGAAISQVASQLISCILVHQFAKKRATQ